MRGPDSFGQGIDMELSLILTLILLVAAIGWNFLQVRTLERRLASLEKQHLALIADLEEKLFPG